MTRVLLIGFGPLGQRIYQMALTRNSESVVAVVDTHPDLAGKDIGDIAGPGKTGVIITSDLESAVRSHKPDIAVVATVSDMLRITPLVEKVVSLGIPVVTTCEELLHPWETAPVLAQGIDSAAMDAGVAVLATGVNPGFLMDSLPAFLTSVCSHIDRIEVDRYQDASKRRIPFQRKIGAGLSIDEFESRKEEGSLRHVGLTESMDFIAAQLGWKLDRREDVISPVVAESVFQVAGKEFPAGIATGVRQVGSGYIGETEKIRLVFQAAVGEPESYDEVRIHGEPNITSRIAGGVHGDIATCAIVLNAIKTVLKARPGLRTMADVGMVVGDGRVSETPRLSRGCSN